MTIHDFRSYNLTKRSRITLEEGKYLGDTVDGLSVYELQDFYVILDEDMAAPFASSFTAVKSAEAVSEKPYIHDPFDEDDEIRLSK